MTPAHAPGFLSFRRTFTLLILLIVVPSAGLSVFGVMAIVNEQAAVEKRMERAWSLHLQQASLGLLAAWTELQTRLLPEGLEVHWQELDLGRSPFRAHDGRIVSADQRQADAIATALPGLGDLSTSPIVFSVADPDGAAFIAAVKRGSDVYGCRLEVAQIDRIIARRRASSEESAQAEVRVSPTRREGRVGMLSRFLSGVSDVREAALGDRELASVVLPRPMEDFKLVAEAAGRDPVAYASRRNRIILSSLLAFLLTTLAVGVVSTARTLHREARLSRLKTDFVSLVSHELRTPLTSIRLFIEMLATQQVNDPAEMKTVLDLLHKETVRLSQFGEAVLDWALIESGKKSYAQVPVSAEALVEAGVGPFRLQCMAEPIAFSVDISAGLPKVNADKEAIGGALLNVLQNALKYTRQEDRKIAVRAREAAGEVLISVEDNGIGISAKDRKRIFERFYRADGLLARSTEGTGLGLAIAERIIASHGGRITVKSTVGAGSTFTIHLPVVADA